MRQSETFIWTAHTENVDLRPVNWLEKIGRDHLRLGARRLAASVSGRCARKGQIKNQITKGEYVVRGIDRIDEEKRQIWFRACGTNPDQDPYFIHYYRVNFDGTRTGRADRRATARTRFSIRPTASISIDTYSRVDLPPDSRAAADVATASWSASWKRRTSPS